MSQLRVGEMGARAYSSMPEVVDISTTLGAIYYCEGTTNGDPSTVVGSG